MPPAPVPWAQIALWTLCGLAAACLLVVVGRMWLARRRLTEQATRPQRMALARLAQAYGRWRATGYMAFMFEVTGIVRTYLAERFGMHAPCRTTSEIAQAVQEHAAIPDPARESLAALLRRCDRIKFAGELTLPEDVAGLHRAAQDFIKDTSWRR